EIAQSNALGCLGVLAKPFDPATLPGKLESLWGGRWEAATATSRESEFEALRRVYVAELPDRIAAMQAAAESLAAGGWDRDTLDVLFRLAHKMAGSAGLYRMPGLSRAAGALEAGLKRLPGPPAPPPGSSPEVPTLFK